MRRLGYRDALVALVLVSVMAIAATLAAVMVPGWQSTRRDPTALAPVIHPHPTQTRDRHAVRAANLRWAARERKDTAAEACERYSTRTWSLRLGTRAEARAVARAIATRFHDPALRSAA